ncbi:hypothetical protein HER10_EVM0007334 [Colletotrichum scovillei]|uniref:Myb-like DNA-binding domain protein n=1 Tax=Colletotrichum scovillei TaxID=1209932 RepID=A0A9P7QZ36_9PEZI|nr:uncharacterized protein HER10_EVM0007334 [Colletotrichum scovillei]KAF4784350.1 hypothetical protein HER10_EVM0007334 [Colletotrichum scovillei]KAG7044850.1 myb-like DNA-binding domain protein [Colletotrichum scovillei]KAG7049560.1 myb-like DNA-binding domain protein [Colletotrichum scovillei]KAG7064303.1 myb-like DNA-binding domain protein [Colletotrichum scovillei]
MEPTTKRPRLGQKAKEDEDDELNYEPEEVSQMRDPGFRFEQSRAFAAFKLKSTFEHIFQKYEKDFTGIGDEIDLRTGKIITNNGHLAGMRYERDTGISEDDDEDEDEGVLLEEAFASDDDEQDGDSGEDDGGENGNSDASDNEDDEERILHGKKNEISNSGALIIKQKGELQRHPTRPNVSPGVSIPGSDQRLSNLAQPRQPGSSTTNPSSNVWGHEPEPVDPTWRVPEISKPKLGDDLMTKLYGARYRFPTSRGFKSVWSSRRDTDEEKALPEPAQIDMKQLIRARNEVPRMARPMSTKLLQAFTDQDDDNEDDILGVAVVGKGPRAANKTSDITDTTVEEAVSATVETDARELEPPIEAKPSKSKPAISKTLSREIGWLNQNKTSVKEGPRPRRQLIPAKVIKPAEASREAEATKPSQPTEKQAQDQSLDSPTEVGVEAGAEAEVEVEVDQNSTSFVTEEELRDMPKQRFVIELFSKIPSPEEITLVEDPEDMDIFDSDHQHEALTPQLANLTVSETTSTTLVAGGDPAAGSVETAVPVKAPSAKPAEPPKETFVRHEIDPSYDFSDDEEGIPTTRIRKLRSGKEMDTVSGAVEVAGHAIQATSGPLEKLSTLDDHRPSHIESDGGPFTTSKTASIEPSDINVGISEKQVDALVEVSEERESLQIEEVSERPIGSDMNSTTLPAEVLTGISPIEGHSSTETTDMAGVEVPSQDEVSAAQEPQTQESLEQNLHTPADQNVFEETILEEAREIQEQIHDDFQKEVQEEMQEQIQKEIQEDIEKAIQEETDEQVQDQVQQQIQEETQDGTQQGSQTEPEKPQQRGETQQDDDQEVIEPFTVPLGLDDIDETSAPEAEPDPEAMEIELPILPPQSRGSLLGPPLRRGRQSSPTKTSGAVDKTATSPLKHMRLQSSSPLKKYSVSKPPAKTKKAVKPRPSASSECKRNPRSRKSALSTLAKSESLTPPPFSSPSPNSTQNQKAAPSTPSSSSRHHQPRTTRDSTSRKSFISLLSDDEDELTLDLFKTHTAASSLGGGGSSAERRRASYTPVLLAGPHTKITTPMKQRSPLVPESGNTGAASATTTGTETTRGKKRKAAWAFATPTRVHFGSPSGSLVQTPGGNMRRCGEDGFRCDRDFCFTCL